MKTTTSLTLILACASTTFAQGLRQATGGVTPTAPPVPWYPEPTPEVSNCTANLITKLCEYKEPASGTAVASSGYKHCWEYCNGHQPCEFVIFVKGNPYTGTGTCWLYPGEKFDKSLGKEGCDYLSVYDKPTCAADPAAPTPTNGGCAATASPSAVAEVCDYPNPEDNCWSSCAASSGASHCLSMCAQADKCNFAIFNPRTDSMSQYQSGTCWMYPNGTYDASKAGKCSGKTEQYVYQNPCPKKGGEQEGEKASGTGSVSPSASASGSTGGALGAEGQDGKLKTEEKGGAEALRISGVLAVGIVVLMWQVLLL